MPKNEDIIVQIMREENCVGQENMIKPDALIEKCAAKGMTDKEVGAAIVSLIDQDIVEYEMDDNLQTSELWLI